MGLTERTRKNLGELVATHVSEEIRFRIHELGLGMWWESLSPFDQKNFLAIIEDMIRRHVNDDGRLGWI